MVVVGFIGGLIAGLTGIGTGIVMLAVLPVILPKYGVPDELTVVVIIANAVFATLVSATANLITTIRRQHFYPRETFWVGTGAIVFSFIVFEYVVKSSFYSKTLFNIILVIILFAILVQTFRKLKLSSVTNESVTWFKMVATGGTAGMLAALTGLGGGVITMPLLNLWLKIDIQKAKSISFGTILVIALWLTINNMLLTGDVVQEGAVGLIVFPMMLPLLIGVVIGSPAGVILSERISSRAVTILFLIVTSIVTIQKISALLP